MTVNVNDVVNEPENPHQNCKIGGHDPGGVTVTVNDVVNEPENPHQNYEIGGQTPVREAGETELSHQEAKIGGQTPVREAGECVVCGKPVAHWGGKPARFCSDGCRKKFTRQQGATGRVATVVEKADSGPPDPGICLDCGQPITAEGFQYRCPACLKARYDRLGREYPEKLVRWLQTHDQKEGRR
jgi:predicted nucleic acid-binding Zn ribbon protein